MTRTSPLEGYHWDEGSEFTLSKEAHAVQPVTVVRLFSTMTGRSGRMLMISGWSVKKEIKGRGHAQPWVLVRNYKPRLDQSGRDSERI
jgi:hypothetical protein